MESENKEQVTVDTTNQYEDTPPKYDGDKPLKAEMEIEPTARARPGMSVFSSWQGRMELAVRIIILILAWPILLVALIVPLFTNWSTINFVPSQIQFSGPFSLLIANVLTMAIGSALGIFLILGGFLELLIIIRIACVKRITTCILIWDIVQSVFIFFGYIIFTGLTIWVGVNWVFTGTGTAIHAEVAIFALCAVFIIFIAILYILKVSLFIVNYRRRVEPKDQDESIPES